jgi:CRISPR/Cas system-associated protein Csx1
LVLIHIGLVLVKPINLWSFLVARKYREQTALSRHTFNICFTHKLRQTEGIQPDEKAVVAFAHAQAQNT